MAVNKNERYFKHGPNLSLYRNIKEQKEYWDELWSSSHYEYIRDNAAHLKLGEFKEPFLKYLPQDSPILEAGCGTGKFVWALRALGYQVEGIDFAEDTIAQIKQVDSSLDVRIGNINSIDRPNNYYGGYISIGVLEHNFKGQEQGVAEAYRVLKPGGIGIITVPYINSKRRRLWEKVPEVKTLKLSNGLVFYQDHLDIRTFRQLLAAKGFILKEEYPYLLFGGLIRDWRLGRWLNRNKFFFYRARKIVKYICIKAPTWIKKKHSHMMMFIVKKPLDL
jgi:SAM-dependent methyltransferase